MNVLKLIGGTIILICGVLSGIYFSGRLQKRIDFIMQYISFLTRAESMISYCSCDIKEILSAAYSIPLINKVTSHCLLLLSKGDTFSEAWNKSIDNKCYEGCFYREDAEMMKAFSADFGVLGVSEETEKLRLHKEIAQQRLSYLIPEAEKQKKLYRTLGTFCGALAAVLMI